MVFVKNQKSKIKKRTGKQTAFTTLELLVTVGIFALLTSVIIGNYPQFGSRLALGRVAREIALEIRQAQVFGIAVKETGFRKSPPFGVSFSTDKPKEFSLFADEIPDRIPVPGDGLYHEGVGCAGDDPLKDDDTECYEHFTIGGGLFIPRLCLNGVDYPTKVTVPEKRVHITFVRPDPEAVIFEDDSPTYSNSVSSVTIVLASERFPDKEKGIRVWITGQIAVVDITTGECS